MKLLVTGGAGYIGAHTCLTLLQAGHDIVVLDNLSNSCRVSLQRVVELSGKSMALVVGDCTDGALLQRLFAEHDVDAVVHFAGLKAVGESVQQPLRYYRNNVYGAQVLLETMQQAGVHRLVFSSSATVYGESASVPMREDAPTGPTNPYGRSKLMIEDMLRDLSQADARWHIAILRYFNPVGAHESGRIGEDPRDIPNNLMPFVAQVAVGRREKLAVFGNDYPTRDGTGVRDYIHVVDLALGHLRALEFLDSHPGAHVFNLGRGEGVSVLELVKAFAETAGKAVPYEFAPRRPGDIAECYADAELAQRCLGWRAERDVQAMVTDTWRWQSNNPDGYAGD